MTWIAALLSAMNLAQHVEWRNEILVIVPDAHEPGDLSDRAQGGPADFLDAPGQFVHRRQDLLRLLVEQQEFMKFRRRLPHPVSSKCTQKTPG